MKFPEIKEGDRFTRLLVIKVLRKNKLGAGLVLCKCECGSSVTASGSDLNNGKIKSCGCLHKDLLSERRRTHGESRRTKEYGTWRNIKDRCFNKNNSRYNRYGGAGVTMCERWINSYETFLNDVGRAPSPNHSIDRYPDKNGNYEPGNVRWATDKEQANNKNRTFVFNINDEILNMSEIQKKYHIDRTTLLKRIYDGFSIEQAIKIKKIQKSRS